MKPRHLFFSLTKEGGPAKRGRDVWSEGCRHQERGLGEWRVLALFLNWGVGGLLLTTAGTQRGLSVASSSDLPREARNCVLSLQTPKFSILATK